MTAETTPLLAVEASPPRRILSPANRVLFAAFFISIALSVTQVPIIYVFRLMECEEFYRHRPRGIGDSCSRNEVDAGTARQVSILGLSTTLCSVVNLFYAGWQIKAWGPRAALVTQTLFPAMRVAIQVVGVAVGANEGIVIIQSSQLVNLVGGMAGYLLVLNTIAGELVPPGQRTAIFGMLQGSVMLGTAVGYLLGGVVGDVWGVRRPFELATVLFALSSLYSRLAIPYMDPKQLQADPSSSSSAVKTSRAASRVFGSLGVLLPRTMVTDSPNGPRRTRHYGVLLLALGVFTGVLATGYAPILIQMYATAAFDFLPTDNGYLMATNSLIRGFFLLFLFPRVILWGRRWFRRDSCDASDAASPEPPLVASKTPDSSGQEFDLFFLRWSLVVDSVVTAGTAFATRKWHIYLAGFMLPFASGSAPASKGVITEMCHPSERADALQAMTLVENVAMLSTLGLFGFVFATFSDLGKAYLTFYCNAAIGLLAVFILSFSRFPAPGSVMASAEDDDE